MLQVLHKLLGIKYSPLNRIFISRSALISNYQYLNNLVDGVVVAPVLKSNAYGHGLVEVAKVLDSVHPPFYCVDSLYEGYELLKAGVKTPILIMGYVDPSNLAVKKLPFSYAVFTKQMLETIAKHQPHSGIHIFVDTGMSREGVSLEDLPSFLNEIKKHKLKVEGVMSHFAKADSPKDVGTISQVHKFSVARKMVRTAGFDPKWEHISASSGLLGAKALGNIGNLARVGTAIYGIDPEGKETRLSPVLSFNTKIAQIKQILKGTKIGYDFTYKAKDNMTIAILPLGYNDGVDRELSNKGMVKVAGKFCPIVGRVSMNITVIDVTGVKVNEGDDVVIYSSKQTDPNGIFSVARKCNRITYEILVHLHPSTRRIVVT